MRKALTRGFTTDAVAPLRDEPLLPSVLAPLTGISLDVPAVRTREIREPRQVRFGRQEQLDVMLKVPIARQTGGLFVTPWRVRMIGRHLNLDPTNRKSLTGQCRPQLARRRDLTWQRPSACRVNIGCDGVIPPSSRMCVNLRPRA